MSHTSRRRTLPSVFACVFLCSLGGAALPGVAFAKNASCHFKAASETIEIHVLADGKTLWSGSIEKGQTKEIFIQEGSFTVLSKLYNPNLKTKEDVRTEAHTQQCRDNAVLTVPLFQSSKEER
jgi:hypothetical protein